MNIITSENITSKQRSKLKSIAAKLSPVTQIGKGGITDNLLKTLSDALEARELIKLKVLENSEESPRSAAEALAAATNSEVVTVIGTKLVLYRESEKNKRIEL